MLLRSVFLVLLLAALGACASAPPRDDSLFRDLGGLPGIGVIVDEFIAVLADDGRIGPSFAGANQRRFREKLTEQLCLLSGGPCEYTGDSMTEVHTGMNITTAQFNALVEDLITAMNRVHVPVTVQNRLLAHLAPLREDIIHH